MNNFLGGYQMSTQPDRHVHSFRRDVVVIPVEAAPRRAQQLGEGV
jgi:hypothetical protein